MSCNSSYCPTGGNALIALHLRLKYHVSVSVPLTGVSVEKSLQSTASCALPADRLFATVTPLAPAQVAFWSNLSITLVMKIDQLGSPKPPPKSPHTASVDRKRLISCLVPFSEVSLRGWGQRGVARGWARNREIPCKCLSVLHPVARRAQVTLTVGSST